MKSALKAVSLPFLVLILSCGDKSTDDGWDGTSTFPLTTDSRWEYARYYYDMPFNDSALADTDFYSIIRHAVGPDTIIGSDQLIAVDDSIAELYSGIGDPYVKRHFYCISDGKLKDYGFNYLFLWGPDDPVYFDPPHILLDLPLMPNKAWTESTEDFVSVYNTVVGIQYVPVADSGIKCDVIRSRMIDERTGHLYYDSYWWYSNDGLMRKEIDFGITVIEDTNGVVIDSVRRLDVLELIDMEIQGGR